MHVELIILFLFHLNLGPHDKDEVIDTRPQQPERPDYNRPDYQHPYGEDIFPSQRPEDQPGYRPNYRPNGRFDNNPQQYKVAVGDGTKISCEIENNNKRTSWRRQDGQPLPSSSHLSGGDLVRTLIQLNLAFH